jgi:hypothetical chaperone protein
LLKTGKPMPVNSYWQAVAINNINDQTDFYSQANGRYLQQLGRDAKQPELFERLIKVHQEKLSYRLVNGAEQAKIGLSNSPEQQILLDDIDQNLSVTVSRDTFLNASTRELNAIAQLMQATLKQAGCEPDVIFVTGGTAKSPVLSHFLQQQFPKTKLVVGDHFGSVTAGLTRWAERIFS